MTDKIELKPCPFCGGEAKLTDLTQAPESWVECKECGARTRFFSNSEEAPVSAWNTRPIEDELRKELRYYRNYSAALEKEVITLREALENIKEKAVLKESEASNATYGFAYEIEELAREALKGGEK